LGQVARPFGTKALVVRGSRSLIESGNWSRIEIALKNSSISFGICEVSGEPSPAMVDSIVKSHHDKKPDIVIGIGGGSAIDAGKAVSAMLPKDGSVTDYLEGIGTRKHDGVKVPFIAVPTTAGTGSEASANAVLSQTGVNGYKRSIRHDNFCPDIALVDPGLVLSCPASVTAACGMDAITQLLESYVSDKASAFTDALVESALPLAGKHLTGAATDRAKDLETRSAMSYASLISGITLANAGLGVVHGFASAIGGFFPVPHGVICGSLLAPSTHLTIDKLLDSDPEYPALRKYARAGEMISGLKEISVTEACDLLVETIDRWTGILGIPRLSQFGISANDIDRIVRETGNKNNPVKLNDSELRQVLLARL